MQKLIRVKDDKDLLVLKMLMDDGWYVVESNIMPFTASSPTAKVTKAYGGYIDYILSDGKDIEWCEECPYKKNAVGTYSVSNLPHEELKLPPIPEGAKVYINGQEELST